jgi:hypothetical protein
VLNVPTPTVRKPGAVWTELPQPASTDTEPVGHVRLGYARASTARQSLDAQLDSLAEAGVTRVFSEKISTRAATRPELEAAVRLAREIRSSGVHVTLVVHEHKGPALAVLRSIRGDAPDAVDSYEVAYLTLDGAQVRVPLVEAWVLRLEDASPARRFTSYKGQRHFPGFPPRRRAVADCCICGVVGDRGAARRV